MLKTCIASKLFLKHSRRKITLRAEVSLLHGSPCKRETSARRVQKDLIRPFLHRSFIDVIDTCRLGATVRKMIDQNLNCGARVEKSISFIFCSSTAFK